MWIYVILLKYFPDDKNEILMAILWQVNCILSDKNGYVKAIV